jgi:hypothetical protein
MATNTNRFDNLLHQVEQRVPWYVIPLSLLAFFAVLYLGAMLGLIPESFINVLIQRSRTLSGNA